MSADVEFDVRDDADDIASAISYSADALDEANSVVVSGGVVTLAEADAIQDISGYLTLQIAIMTFQIQPLLSYLVVMLF